jgi:hypothetical protein
MFEYRRWNKNRRRKIKKIKTERWRGRREEGKVVGREGKKGN